METKAKFLETIKQLIASLGTHIQRELSRTAPTVYHPILIHILASNFAESLLEVARHYESQALVKELLGLVAKCYYEGVNSL